MRRFKLTALLLALALLAGCAAPARSLPAAGAGGRALTDGAGRQVALPERVDRVVCAGVGALRYTCYLGAADRVAGVEDYELTPDPARPYSLVNAGYFEGLPVIGTNGAPDAELILASGAQAVILSEYAAVDPDQLAARTGLPVVVVPGSDAALDDKAFETLRILGEVFGLEERAEELTAYLESLKADLADRGKAAGAGPAAYVGGVAYKGYRGFGGTEAGYGPLALLGAVNLADSVGQPGAFELDTEQVLAWDPEVIFLDLTGLSLIREDCAGRPEFYSSLTAVRTGRVYAQAPFRSYAVNLELALADAYYAGSVLCPEAFADLDFEAKAREIFVRLLGRDIFDELEDAGYVFKAIDLFA